MKVQVSALGELRQGDGKFEASLECFYNKVNLKREGEGKRRQRTENGKKSRLLLTETFKVSNYSLCGCFFEEKCEEISQRLLSYMP